MSRYFRLGNIGRIVELARPELKWHQKLFKADCEAISGSNVSFHIIKVPRLWMHLSKCRFFNLERYIRVIHCWDQAILWFGWWVTQQRCNSINHMRISMAHWVWVEHSSCFHWIRGPAATAHRRSIECGINGIRCPPTSGSFALNLKIRQNLKYFLCMLDLITWIYNFLVKPV